MFNRILKGILASAFVALMAGSASAGTMDSPSGGPSLGGGMNIFSIALGASDDTSSLTDVPAWSFSSMSSETVWDTYDPNGDGRWADIFGFQRTSSGGSSGTGGGIGEPGSNVNGLRVPEPGMLALAGLGLLAFGALRRRISR